MKRRTKLAQESDSERIWKNAANTCVRRLWEKAEETDPLLHFLSKASTFGCAGMHLEWRPNRTSNLTVTVLWQCNRTKLAHGSVKDCRKGVKDLVDQHKASFFRDLEKMYSLKQAPSLRRYRRVGQDPLKTFPVHYAGCNGSKFASPLWRAWELVYDHPNLTHISGTLFPFGACIVSRRLRRKLVFTALKPDSEIIEEPFVGRERGWLLYPGAVSCYYMTKQPVESWCDDGHRELGMYYAFQLAPEKIVRLRPMTKHESLRLT